MKNSISKYIFLRYEKNKKIEEVPFRYVYEMFNKHFHVILSQYQYCLVKKNHHKDFR